MVGVTRDSRSERRMTMSSTAGSARGVVLNREETTAAADKRSRLIAGDFDRSWLSSANLC